MKLMILLSIMSVFISCEDINLDTLKDISPGDTLACEAPATSTTCTNCVIYETNAYTLLTGGISQADSICNSDSAKPNAGVYKAFLVDTSTRNAFPCKKDWVMATNTTYYRGYDNAVIGTTNSSALLAFPLTSSFGTGAIWDKTGMNTDYSTHPDNCNNWTDTSAGVNGRISEYGSGTTATAALSSYSDPCNNTTALLCVEQ